MRMGRLTLRRLLGGAAASMLVLAGLSLHPIGASGVTLPPEFTQSTYATGLGPVTAMAFAPDGRLFVSSQDGTVRVVKNGGTPVTQFGKVTTEYNGELGLTGLTLDPNFATNRFVYLYYATKTTPSRNKVVRLVANGDVAVANPDGTPVETTLLELDPLGANIHVGGALNFGADGKLYVATGDNATPTNAQSTGTTMGKILRINPDGSIPADNPFYATTAGINRTIWATGFRNPFTFAVQPTTGRTFVNDVGQDAYEEIDELVKGGNFGWPTTEGPTSDPQFVGPRYAYHHTTGSVTGCAITGGAFYNPSTVAFPNEYVGDYLFADYCGQWIKRLDPDTGTVTDFASQTTAQPIDIKVGPDGNVYYLSRGQGTVTKISYTGTLAPSIVTPPASQTVSVGEPVTFSVEASGGSPLSYQWQRDGQDIAGATARTFTVPATTNEDDGAAFRAVVSNPVGSATSSAAVLTVQDNQPPEASIVTPAVGSQYSAGQSISFSGAGTDPEDGTLPASAYTWSIDLHHNVHSHPAMPPTSGAKSGTYAVPQEGHTESSVFYRVTLTVKDSKGREDTTHVDVNPRKVKLTLAANVSGLQVTLDGQPRTTPYVEDSVVGVKRSLGVLTPQALNGRTYAFGSWSDGGAATHQVVTPQANTTYTATFSAPSTVLLNPTADSYVTTKTRTTNFGSSTSLYARGGTMPEVSYLRFTLPAAPVGSTLRSATLRLRTSTGASAGSAVAQTVTLADNGTWTESGLTWNNRPATRQSLGSVAAGARPNTTYNISLRAADLAARLGTTISIAVVGGSADNLWFWSRNHATASYRPQVTLQFG